MTKEKVTIDRVEEHIAVMSVRDAETVQINFPVVLLPEGCREGGILIINIRRGSEVTAEARERVSNLLEKLKRKQG